SRWAHVPARRRLPTMQQHRLSRAHRGLRNAGDDPARRGRGELQRSGAFPRHRTQADVRPYPAATCGSACGAGEHDGRGSDEGMDHHGRLRAPMAYFAYKGRDAKGVLVQGVLEGADSSAVAAQLFDSGVTPIEIGEPTRAASAAEGGKSSGLWQLRQPKATPVDLMLFSRQMYSLLKAGVPILRALAGLEESSVNPAFKTALHGVRENLESGRELSTSLQRQGSVFSPYYVSMVYVGETTGRLEEVFLRLYH